MRQRSRNRRTLETALINLVLVLTAALSVTGLITRSLEVGAFDDAVILGAAWITPLLLSLGWALSIDLPIYAAISIIRREPRNPAAWALLVLFAALTVFFQAHGPAIWMVKATTPVALVLIVVARHLVPVLRGDVELTDEPAPQSAPLRSGQRLARVDTDDPDRTLEWVDPPPSVRVDIHNDIHSQAAARSGASAAADPTAASTADTAAATAGTSTRALVTAAWERHEVEGGQRLSAAALARTLTEQRGQRVPEGTVRAELTRLRGNHDRSQET